MRTVPVLTGAEAAQLITDSAVITVSSSSGLGCPDAVLKAIGQRYEETGSPANLTTLHPIAAGDMYGIKGIDVRKQALDQRGKWPAEKGAVIAVSAAHLQGFGIEPELRPLYGQLRDRDPLVILGGSIYLYDLSPGK